MKGNIEVIAAEVAQLRKLVEHHENRITALEKKLNPKTAEEMSTTAMDMLLAELADLGKEEQG